MIFVNGGWMPKRWHEEPRKARNPFHKEETIQDEITQEKPNPPRLRHWKRMIRRIACNLPFVRVQDQGEPLGVYLYGSCLLCFRGYCDEKGYLVPRGDKDSRQGVRFGVYTEGDSRVDFRYSFDELHRDRRMTEVVSQLRALIEPRINHLRPVCEMVEQIKVHAKQCAEEHDGSVSFGRHRIANDFLFAGLCIPNYTIWMYVNLSTQEIRIDAGKYARDVICIDKQAVFGGAHQEGVLESIKEYICSVIQECKSQ